MDVEAIRNLPLGVVIEATGVASGDRVYPVRSLKDRRLVGVYVRDQGWVWRPVYEHPEPHVIMVQGYPVAIR